MHRLLSDARQQGNTHPQTFFTLQLYLLVKLSRLLEADIEPTVAIQVYAPSSVELNGSIVKTDDVVVPLTEVLMKM